MTQDADGIVANLASSSSDGSSTGRNAALGLGGIALLAAGLGGGFLADRRPAGATPA